MRIAVVAHDYPSPGSNAGAFVQARVDLYRRTGHEVDVFSRRLRPSWRPHYDVIQVHYPLSEFNIPFVQRLHNASPVIAFLHGAEAIRTPDKPRLWGFKQKLATRRFVRSCDVAVTASRWMQAQAEAYLDVNSTVIPNVVDDELFALHEGPRPSKALCLRGSLPKYGVDVLQEALPLLEQPTDIRQPVYSRAELPALLKHYEVFVAPSRLEGQGLMACEAAASGLKVVTTRVGGIPEFFGPGDAVFIEDLTPRCVAQAVRAAFGWRPDLRAIRERVLGCCGPAVTVRQEIELMETLAG